MCRECESSNGKQAFQNQSSLQYKKSKNLKIECENERTLMYSQVTVSINERVKGYNSPSKVRKNVISEKQRARLELEFSHLWRIKPRPSVKVFLPSPKPRSMKMGATLV